MNQNKNISLKSKIARFFTQTIRHNWLYILLSLFSGTLAVLLINFAA